MTEKEFSFYEDQKSIRKQKCLSVVEPLTDTEIKFKKGMDLYRSSVTHQLFIPAVKPIHLFPHRMKVNQSRQHYLNVHHQKKTFTLRLLL